MKHVLLVVLSLLMASHLPKPASAAAYRPAAARSTVHRFSNANPRVACRLANEAASARTKRLSTCVLKIATPEQCKLARGLYTAGAVSADARCYAAKPPRKPLELLSQ